MTTCPARRDAIATFVSYRRLKLVALGLVLGCGSSPSAPEPPVPGSQAASREELRNELASDRPASADELLARWTPKQLSKLPYDPSAAVGLSLIQASTLKLNDRELEAYGKQGLVISGRQQFPSFFMGYKAIYADDLPLYVSADSILFAVHRSYDKMLLELEREALKPLLEMFLMGVRSRLASTSGAHDPDAARDVDESLAIALRLLGKPAAPVAGGRQQQVDLLVERAMAAAGTEDVVLCGLDRRIDFSQMKPRGHYTDDPQMQQYFRAMMWLGRADTAMPLVTVEQGKAYLQRRCLAAAALIAELAEPGLDGWKRIDQTLRGFVGESDNMVVTDFPRLHQLLGTTTARELAARDEAELIGAIVDGGFGIQRIASQVLFVPPEGANDPLDRTFQMFGQRFVIDSEVLSNVVFDRVLPQGGRKRMMPSALDVAFAALGSDAAAPLLDDELRAFKNYPGALADARRLVDRHEPEFWQASLYGSWLAALRGLSPPHDGTDPALTKLPAIAGTDAWARRTLNAQLASWAELRHDTLLYAKQSYTAFPVCEFPDAYVEPSVPFWQALVRFAARGKALVSALPTSGVRIGSYFAKLERTAAMLRGMAQKQQRGEPFTGEEMAFINQAVELKEESVVCTTVRRPAGWYPDLFFDKDDATREDPTVADIHTQPADETGSEVGRVLHAATGWPRLMVVSFETCKGPRAYAGLASTYLERTTEKYERLDDQAWLAQLRAGVPDVPWLGGVLVK